MWNERSTFHVTILKEIHFLMILCQYREVVFSLWYRKKLHRKPFKYIIITTPTVDGWCVRLRPCLNFLCQGLCPSNHHKFTLEAAAGVNKLFFFILSSGAELSQQAAEHQNLRQVHGLQTWAVKGSRRNLILRTLMHLLQLSDYCGFAVANSW